MDRKRLRLDNPVFQGTLRQPVRSVPYARRPMQAATIDDVVTARVRNRSQITRARSVARTQSASQPMPAKKPVASHSKGAVMSQTLSEQTVEPQLTAISRAVFMLQQYRQRVLYVMAGLVFLAGIAASLTGLRTNHQVAAQVKHSQQASENTADAETTAPSTVKPSDTVVRNYAVSPNLPRYLDIPKLGVHTRTLSEGVAKNGELQVPWNIYDTGWYNASSQPGQNGAMLVDGHSGIGKLHGVFWQISTLVAGDPIVVTRGDGQKFTYKVVNVQTADVKNIDMSSMLVSANTAKPGLNLITCAGDQIPGTTELSKRVQVFAVAQ